MVVKIFKENGSLKAIDSNGNPVSFNKKYEGQPTIYYGTAQKWHDDGNVFKLVNDAWEKAPLSAYEKEMSNNSSEPIPSNLPKEQTELISFINTSFDLKPEVLKLSELKWKYLMRSIMRGKNIMMTGPAGCGKTMAAKAAITALERPEFYFNLGATQDPRSTLIGNTHFNKEDGTYFSEALFVKAIQTENSVILLDELSRAHPDAHNILMTVLDEGQRYLRLDEAQDSPTIKVANGVTFIATANIGNEYTATRVMDRALMDRFVIVEMDVLKEEEEISLLSYLFPNTNEGDIKSIANIVSGTRLEMLSDNPRISTSISTRVSVEMASLMYDGFSIEEASEVCIYPQFDQSGGLDSERTFVKQLVQKHVKIDSVSDQLFDLEDELTQTNADGTVSV